MPDEEEQLREQVRGAEAQMREAVDRQVFGPSVYNTKHLREAYNWVFDKIDEARRMNFNLCQLKEVVQDVLKHIE